MKKIDYNAIQKKIDNNYLDLKSGILDVYDFTGDISKEFIKPVDPQWGNRIEEDPYTDLIFAMLEINGITLY